MNRDVWNIKDVIGLGILAVIILVFILLSVYDWICEKIDSWKNKK